MQVVRSLNSIARAVWQLVDLADRTVTTDGGTVDTVGSVTAVGSGAITSSSLANGTITANSIASSAITDAKIASGAITSEKFASGAITASAIASNAITSAKFASGAITSTVIASNAIGSDQFTQNAADKVWNTTETSRTVYSVTTHVNGNVVGNVLGTVGGVATDGIASWSFASGAITANAIAADAIGASEFAQGAADKVWATSSRTLTDFSSSFKSGYQLIAGSYDVTEFCQRGTVTYNSGSGTSPAGISTVTLTKSHMTTTGWNNSDGAALPSRVTLAETAVSMTQSANNVTNTIGFEIADFAG